MSDKETKWVQNHSSAALFTVCVYECLMKIFKILSSYNVPKLRYEPITLDIQTCNTRHKSLNCDNIEYLFLCLKLEQPCRSFTS